MVLSGVTKQLWGAFLNSCPDNVVINYAKITVTILTVTFCEIL